MDQIIPLMDQNSQNTVNMNEAAEYPTQEETDGFIQDDTFSYDGYQVVRGEFFAHISEPSLSFCANKVYVNSACLKKMQETDYVQILVNPDEKKLVVRPASEDEKDSFLWCNAKRKPKQITCRVFFAKIFTLLEWNPDYRYKLMGKLIRSGQEKLLVFDLTATEIYVRVIKENGKYKAARKPVYPAEWGNQFGLPVEEHRKQLQINIFNGYTVFGLKDSSSAHPESPVNTEGGND